MNLNPFINLIGNLLSLYSFMLFIWMILGWLIRFNIINSYQSFVKTMMRFGSNLFEPVLDRIRKFVPLIGEIDISPVILLLLIGFAKEALFTYLYRF